MEKIKIVGIIIIIMELFSCSKKNNQQQNMNIGSLSQIQQNHEIGESNNQQYEEIEDDFIEYDDENNFEIDTPSHIIGNGNAKITKYTGENLDVRIPPVIKGFTVTHIEGFNDRGLNSVIIPNNVRLIGHAAFSDNKIKNIKIPNSVDSIINYAFYNNQLTNIKIPNSVEYIGMGAFEKNPINMITIGANVNLATPSIKEGNVFDNNFDEFYEGNGKKAGTYIYINNNWKIQ